jgi:Carboxypeptidase regulatory-like domain
MKGRFVFRIVVSAALLVPVAGTRLGGQTQPRDPRPTPSTRIGQPGTASGQPPRDRVPVPQVGTAAIKGRVVDGATGRPIARARLRLSGGANSQLLTDGEGRFAFENLPQGLYTIYVEKVTYMATVYPEPGRSLRNRMRPLTVNNGEVLDNVTVPMFGGSAIAGRIVDAHGDPVENANVTVLGIPRSGRPQQRGGGMSNDLGEFRIPRLPPGRYLLRVRPQPSYPHGGPGGEETLLAQALPTYFPNSVALEQAQAITLGRGETVSDADVVMAEGTPSIVKGVLVASDGQPIGNGNISARMTGANDVGGFDSGTGVQPDGTFRLQLPPGEFQLFARAAGRLPPNQPVKPGDEQYAAVRITVPGGTVESIAILLGRGATASGRVVFEGPSPVPPPPAAATARVPMFNPEDPTCRSGQVTIEPDWSFKVEGLIGTCMALPHGSFGRWTVKAVTFRGQKLLDRSFTFEPGQHYGNIQVVVTDRRSQVDLVVTDELGAPTRDYVAVAFPADKERWTQLSRYVRTYSPAPLPPGIQDTAVAQVRIAGSPAGSGEVIGIVRGATNFRYQIPGAHLSDLPAGEYYLIAVDDMEPDDSQDPAVLERLIASATKIFVSTDTPLEVPLRRIPFATIVR